MKHTLILILLMCVGAQLHAQQWTAIAPMHFARAEAEAVQLHNGTILVVGGYADGVVEGTCEIYNPKTDTWTLTGSLSTPRFRFALNILPSGKVVALGGLTDLDVGTTNSCEVYDPASGTWTTFGTLPEASENFPTCYLDDSTLVFLGGLDANITNFLETSGEINPNTLAMTAIPPMLIGNYSDFGEFLSSRQMIVVGGGDLGGVGGPYLRSTEVFDLSTQQWTFVDSLVTVASDGNHHIVKLDDDRLVIPSGRSGPNTETLEVQVFDPKTLTWSAPGSLPRTHFHCYSILVGEDSILTIGGALDPATTDDIVSYTDWYNCRDSTSWEGPSMIDPRHVYSAVNLLLPVPGSTCADSEAIYVFGGETTGKVDINRCERLVLGMQYPKGYGGPTTLALPTTTQSILEGGCGTVDTSVVLGITGCNVSSGMLDSVWLSGSAAFSITDTRSTPRSLAALDSIAISYLGTSGSDTAELHIRYDLGSGAQDTVVTVIGSLASPLLAEPEQIHREAASAYYGQTDTLPLDIDVSASINLNSLWPYLTDIQASYTWDSSVVSYTTYLAPSGWSLSSLTGLGDSVAFEIHKLNASVGNPLDLGTALFQPNGEQLATTWVSLPSLMTTIGGKKLSLCVTDNEDNHWAVKTLGVLSGVAGSPPTTPEFVLYPDPAEDELFIQNPSEQQASITLYDAIGRIVGTTTVEAQSTATVDTHTLTSGVYFVRFVSGGVMSSNVFVKN